MEYRREKVKGYEDYEVDTNGVVYSKRGKPLKYSLNHSGYRMINFYVNNHRKGFAIHTIVANQFLVKTDETKNQVNHIDGNRQNNNVDNLEWCTPSENVWHAIHILGHDKTGSKNVNARPVIAYHKDGSVYKQYNSISDAAKEFTNDEHNYIYAHNSIWRVLSNRRKSYKGLLWYYNAEQAPVIERQPCSAAS